MIVIFSFNATAHTEIYTLSLHDALPISRPQQGVSTETIARKRSGQPGLELRAGEDWLQYAMGPTSFSTSAISTMRSEEHTSELQSLTNLVCRLLLEKKK